MPHRMLKAIQFKDRAAELCRMAKDVREADWRKRILDLAVQYDEIARNYERTSTLTTAA